MKKVNYLQGTNLYYLESTKYEKVSFPFEVDGKQFLFSFYIQGKMSPPQVSIGDVLIPYHPARFGNFYRVKKWWEFWR